MIKLKEHGIKECYEGETVDAIVFPSRIDAVVHTLKSLDELPQNREQITLKKLEMQLNGLTDVLTKYIDTMPDEEPEEIEEVPTVEKDSLGHFRVID